jgi:hypothetical protein
MSANTVPQAIETSVGLPERISISPWVNEPYPAWDLMLTAHDVARLIRRPPWMIRSLAAVGRFPPKRRFRGKKIGWLKADILDWMAHGSRYRFANLVVEVSVCERRRSGSPGQQTLPLQYPPARTFDGRPTFSYIAGVSS